MQAKKRAKPVKFGKNAQQSSAKDEEQLKNIQETAEEIKKRVSALEDTEEDLKKDIEELVDEKGEGTDEKEETEHHPVEAHFSSVQTFDIKEEPEEDEGKEKEEVTEDADVPQEKAEGSMEEESQVEDKPAADQEAASASQEEGESDSQENEEYFSKPPDDAEKKSNPFSYFFKVVVITFLIGLAFIGGIYYALTNKNVRNILPFKKEEITEAPVTEAPTEAPVDLTKYEIKLLNGSGTGGVAAKLKTELESEGFKVGEVGNADNSDYEKTEIAAGKSVDKGYIDKLKEALSKSYEVAQSPRTASGEADVVVTIGSQLAK